MPSGWVVLDKPSGLGSTQAVAALKRNLRESGHGKVKVGHGGTLDPLATGVLPLAVGEATKLAGRMLDASKVYVFSLIYGTETDTLDGEGDPVAHSDVRPSPQDVMAVLPRFTGAMAQLPPAFSALKLGGVRAYDLARAGKEVALAPRDITIHTLELVAADAQQATLRAHVSKGTYIRSLARDLAHALGTRGHVGLLRREKAGPFRLDQAISLDKLNEIGKGAPLEQIFLPVEAGLDDIPALDLNPEQARATRQGRVLSGLPHDDGLYWARASGVLVALIQLTAGTVRIVRGFNLADVAE